MLGLLLNVFPLNHVALVSVLIYCAYYGPVEAIRISGLPPPGSRWQVPQSLVAGVSRRRRILIWGAILGPGLATRNPYAGFGLLPLVVAALGSIGTGAFAAAAMGIAHGTGRALAMLRDTRRIDGTEYLQSILRSMYWRTLDGVVLLLIGGIAVIAYAQTL